MEQELKCESPSTLASFVARLCLCMVALRLIHRNS